MSNLVYENELPGYVEPAEPSRVEKPQAKPLCPGLATAEVPVQPVLACTKCNGAGHTLSMGYSYTKDDGTLRVVPTKWKTCIYCDGAAWFHAPDLELLVKAVTGRKPRTLRSKRPDDARPYYVWRLTRFHGGKDVCLPMGAEMEIAGDPFRDVLDELARLIARAYFGSGNVGTARWQQAMYGSHSFDDLPSHLDGPPHDGNKPLEEMLETV